MDVLAFLIAIVALVVAVLAYRRAGGLRDVRSELTVLRSALDGLRAKTADVLFKMEQAVRPGTGAERDGSTVDPASTRDPGAAKGPG